MAIPVTFLITDLHRGGSPLVLAALAAGLARRGRIAPTVVSLAPLGEIAELIQTAGVRVISLEARGNSDLAVVGRFAEFLQSERPTLVCSILVHANLVAAAARTLSPGPCVWVQSIHTVQEKPRWHWYLQGILSGRADAIVAPSRAVLRKMEAYGPVPCPTVIANGIDLARFEQAEAIEKSQRPWPADAWVVGYVGRFDPVKRLPLLIGGVKELMQRDAGLAQRLHLALVGYGAVEAGLRQLVDELGLKERVHFPGPTKVPERWMKSFDVFGSPSGAEGFGLTLVEAGVAGLPVMACAAAGVMESLSGAIWIPAEPTVGDVAGALARAWKGEGKVLQGLVGQRFSEERMIERYEEQFLRWIRAGL